MKANYMRETNSRIRMIDSLVISLALVSLLQVAYAVVGGSTFPFNSFLSGLFSSTGTLVLAVCLRMQLTNQDIFDVKPERAFADFLVTVAVLQIAVFNFLG